MSQPDKLPVDLTQAIDAMPVEYLHCRDFGHSWRPFRATWMPSFRYYEETLKCQRCKTTRTRFIGPQGQMAGGSYEYADGYTVKGLGRLTGGDRDQIRLASVKQLLPKPRRSTKALPEGDAQ